MFQTSGMLLEGGLSCLISLLVSVWPQQKEEVLSEVGFEPSPPGRSSHRSDRPTFRSVGGWRPIKSAAPTFRPPIAFAQLQHLTNHDGEMLDGTPSEAEKICGNLRRFRGFEFEASDCDNRSGTKLSWTHVHFGGFQLFTGTVNLVLPFRGWCYVWRGCKEFLTLLYLFS